jgi:hypothetical protein
VAEPPFYLDVEDALVDAVFKPSDIARLEAPEKQLATLRRKIRRAAANAAPKIELVRLPADNR